MENPDLEVGQRQSPSLELRAGENTENNQPEPISLATVITATTQLSNKLDSFHRETKGEIKQLEEEINKKLVRIETRFVNQGEEILKKMDEIEKKKFNSNNVNLTN